MVKLGKMGILALTLMLSGKVINVQANCECDDVPSQERISLSSIDFNSSKRYPQTVIYDIVNDFLYQTDEHKEKKVLVLGYDGFREDALENIMSMEYSAVKSIANEGGLYPSYAGADGKQETSTAPGWLSILSGDWAYKLGVKDNNGVKSKDIPTFLSEAVQAGYSSTFIASWAPHFDVTYKEDVLHSDGKPVYKQMIDDNETISELNTVLSDTSNDSYDVMFATLEYTDHAGHSIGYGNQVKEYVEASLQVDRETYELLQTIYQRESYELEDWLILLTSDHGGIDKNHGNQSLEERNTWFAVNKKIDLK